MRKLSMLIDGNYIRWANENKTEFEIGNENLMLNLNIDLVIKIFSIKIDSIASTIAIIIFHAKAHHLSLSVNNVMVG